MPGQEFEAWLRLLLTPGVGRENARKLLSAFGLPEQVFAQPRFAVAQVVGPRLADALQLTPPELPAAVEQLTHWLAGATDRHVLTLGDPAYPADLLHIADPPVMLYVQGNPAVLQHPARLAVVGSRNPTAQGATNARQFAQALGEAGLCIVSGLALGIDGAAHQGALDAGAPTIAVIGTGVDRVYPRRNLDLAHAIAAHGAIVSEFPLGTAPLAAHFPQRNRIIAGLSQGTLVVEAALQSGSLITARVAGEQGKEVFAIPGSIHSPQSRGCHALIRQGAKLVESAQDILEDLRLVPLPLQPAADSGQRQDEKKSSPLLEAVGFDPVSLDALQARTGLDTATLLAQLLELELDGHVARLPGGLLQRVGSA